jgi:hypothetical protein
MKLVREHINEKFTEESDPIHDMGIGKIKFEDIYNTLQPPNIQEKWKKFVYDLKGRTIIGRMGPTGFTKDATGAYIGGGITSRSGVFELPILKVKVAQSQPIYEPGNIMIKDDKGNNYVLIYNEEYIIK